MTANPASLPDTCEQIMEDVRNGGDSVDGSSLCLATPPSTPTSNLGPRYALYYIIPGWMSDSIWNNGPDWPHRLFIASH